MTEINKKYLYLLTVQDDESGEEIGHIEAFSEESLLEQLRKIDSSIKKYEEEKLNEKLEEVLEEESDEEEKTVFMNWMEDEQAKSRLKSRNLEI